MGGETMPLLDVSHLQVVRDGRHILDDVNLQVQPGSLHAVLGLNGSGKSTLAYTLMGSAGYAPNAGRIVFAGHDVTNLSMSERGRLGITLAWQEPARFEGLTVRRYLSLGMNPANPQRLHDALEAVGLDDAYLGRMVDDALSGGERKRIELAAVYAMGPRLAILDEPDSGIDTLTLSDIGGLIHKMVSEGSTVLLISHRDEIVDLADTASLICEGRVVQTGDPKRVCDRYARCCRPCEVRETVESEREYERL